MIRTTTNQGVAKMRSQFIESANRKEAARKAPWACILVKVEGGYYGFESVADYTTWKAQK